MSPHAHLARSPVRLADKVRLEDLGREPGENSPWDRSRVLAQGPKLATETLIPQDWMGPPTLRYQGNVDDPSSLIRTIPTYSVYGTIARLLRVSPESGLFLMAEARWQRARSLPRQTDQAIVSRPFVQVSHA